MENTVSNADLPKGHKQTKTEDFFRSVVIASSIYNELEVEFCEDLARESDEAIMRCRNMGRMRLHKFRESFGYGDDRPQPYKGPKWEYKCDSAFLSRIHDVMNTVGNEGWELVSVIASPDNKYEVNLFFKRLKK